MPLVLFVACAKAESQLTPTAFRNGQWPDVSAGPFQQTIMFAVENGIGTGQNTPENIALCQAKLSDWETASNVAGKKLSGCLQQAREFEPGATGDRLCLLALSAYNSGSPKDETTAWWNGEQRTNYVSGLEYAHRIVG